MAGTSYGTVAFYRLLWHTSVCIRGSEECVLEALRHQIRVTRRQVTASGTFTRTYPKVLDLEGRDSGAVWRGERYILLGYCCLPGQAEKPGETPGPQPHTRTSSRQRGLNMYLCIYVPLLGGEISFLQYFNLHRHSGELRELALSPRFAFWASRLLGVPRVRRGAERRAAQSSALSLCVCVCVCVCVRVCVGVGCHVDLGALGLCHEVSIRMPSSRSAQVPALALSDGWLWWLWWLR